MSHTTVIWSGAVSTRRCYSCSSQVKKRDGGAAVIDWAGRVCQASSTKRRNNSPQETIPLKLLALFSDGFMSVWMKGGFSSPFWRNLDVSKTNKRISRLTNQDYLPFQMLVKEKRKPNALCLPTFFAFLIRKTEHELLQSHLNQKKRQKKNNILYQHTVKGWKSNIA